MALFGIMGGVLSPGDHLITTSIEHHAVLHAAQELEARGVEVTYLPCTPEGLIEVPALEAALRPNTKLVSVMLANNETGVIQPVRELADQAHAAGALFHTDAIQAAGKLPLDVKALGCDLLSVSGHKMYAPQGTGALFVRRNVRLQSMFFGGLHERGRRPGTENVAGIVGLGKAADVAKTWLAADGPRELAALRDRLEQGILGAVESAGVNGGGAQRVANTSNLYFDQVEAEALVIALDLKGLAVSGGSACQSGATEPSHVLTAMGLNDARARGSVRFSLSRLNTQDEVDAAIAMIPAAVARLRELSPSRPIAAAMSSQR
jgi:cysteine desulfurase